MTRATAILASAALLAAIPAAAGPYLGNGGIAPLPMPRRIAVDEERGTPHPATYAEQFAQGLGIRDGKMDMFEIAPKASRDSLMPTLSGSLGGQGVTLRLQWKP